MSKTLIFPHFRKQRCSQFKWHCMCVLQPICSIFCTNLYTRTFNVSAEFEIVCLIFVIVRKFTPMDRETWLNWCRIWQTARNSGHPWVDLKFVCFAWRIFTKDVTQKNMRTDGRTSFNRLKIWSVLLDVINCWQIKK